jgi:hypothetical protein
MKVNTETGLVVIPDRMVIEKLPDTDRFKNRIKINSETSNRIYLISYDSAKGSGYWTCSCPGNIRHGQCKHLRALGLVTRYDMTVKRVK